MQLYILYVKNVYNRYNSKRNLTVSISIKYEIDFLRKIAMFGSRAPRVDDIANVLGYTSLLHCACFD